MGVAVPGLDVVAGIKRLLLLCVIRGLVPGLALAVTKLVVELESIALLVASALAMSERMDGCVVNVCVESILSSVKDSSASLLDDEFESDDEASIVDRSMPIPAPAPAPISILVLSTIS